MIYQGSNMPLVIGLKTSVSDAQYIHVILTGYTGELKHWTDTDITVTDDGLGLICPLKQAETFAMPVGVAKCTVRWLDADGIVWSAGPYELRVGPMADKHVLGTDAAITETGIEFTADTNAAQGVLTPDSIRQAIVVKCGTATDTQVAAWMAAHTAQLKGPQGDPGAAAKINGVNTLQLQAGDNVTLTQSGDKLTISASGGAAESVAWSDITGKPQTYTPASHSHSQGDVTGLTDALSGKANASHGHEIADVTGLQTALDGKQEAGSYAEQNHSHSQSDVSGLSDALAGKASSNHTHTIANVSGLQTALDGKQAAGSYAAASHTHQDADVPGLEDIKQDISALQTGKANTSHSHTTADLTDWIPMSTAVKTALTDTTAPAWTATEQASARARLGAAGDEKLELLETITLTGTETEIKRYRKLKACVLLFENVLPSDASANRLLRANMYYTASNTVALGGFYFDTWKTQGYVLLKTYLQFGMWQSIRQTSASNGAYNATYVSNPIIQNTRIESDYPYTGYQTIGFSVPPTAGGVIKIYGIQAEE